MRRKRFLFCLLEKGFCFVFFRLSQNDWCVEFLAFYFDAAPAYVFVLDLLRTRNTSRSDRSLLLFV